MALRLDHDDDMRRVDQRWLGPKGVDLFAVRYSALIVGGALLTVLVVLAHRILNGTTFPWLCVIVWAATKAILRGVTHDRPMMSIVRVFHAEMRRARQRPPASFQVRPWQPKAVNWR
jgi:hypothetical protein